MLAIRYHGTNCFFVPHPEHRELLAVDVGWPCSLTEYRRLMKGIGLRFQDIRRALVTHLHMDHAGLLGEFLRQGIECVLIGEQDAAAVEEMERTIVKNREYGDYVPIDRALTQRLSIEAFPAAARSWGFNLEVAATPSHSRDSLSFLVGREAIIGDLTSRDQLLEENAAAHADWNKLVDLGVGRVYPSHAPAAAL